MTEFTIGSIAPTEENADSIIRLNRQDLLRAGLTEGEILQYAYPSIEAQRTRIANNPERYLGAYAIAGGEVAGYAIYNEWLRGDQEPFESLVVRVKLKMLSAAGRVHLPNRPQGIFGLVVSDTVEDRPAVADLLSREVIGFSEGREMRITQYPGDPVEPVLRDNGFYPTGKFGKVVGVRQELYVRKAT